MIETQITNELRVKQTIEKERRSEIKREIIKIFYLKSL